MNTVKTTNPFTRECLEYPLFLLDCTDLEYYICHETPFSDRYSEWLVATLKNGDTIYIPYNNNRNGYVHIVTRDFVALPHDIYTIPFSYFLSADLNNLRMVL